MTAGLQTCQEKFSIFMMQIVLVCETIFGQIWIKRLISAQLIEEKVGGNKREQIGMGGSGWKHGSVQTSFK